VFIAVANPAFLTVFAAALWYVPIAPCWPATINSGINLHGGNGKSVGKIRRRLLHGEVMLKETGPPPPSRSPTRPPPVLHPSPRSIQTSALQPVGIRFFSTFASAFSPDFSRGLWIIG